MSALAWSMLLTIVNCGAGLYITRDAERHPQLVGRAALTTLTGMLGWILSSLVWSFVVDDKAGVVICIVNLAWLAWCWWQVYKALKPPRKRRRRSLAARVKSVAGRLVVVPGHQPT